uniref:Chaperone protein TorD n=1 Tax=uncultured Dehalococcoidia bacterium TaxID=498747 RepID=A0A871XZB0_9CHLR|nr:Chaperone protein TorD [uncultured Dehalococcoidia bacterium]
MSQDKTNALRTTQGRAKIWGLMVRIFVSVPDESLIAEVNAPAFRSFLEAYGQLGEANLSTGVQEITAYLDSITKMDVETTLKLLMADRARLFRSSANSTFKPPYENLYRPNPGENRLAAELREFYKKENLSPDQLDSELPDYLGVELNFIYQLVQREADEWMIGDNALKTAVAEVEFLRQHLGNWIGKYVAEARQSAATGFYRGFLTMLEGFIAMERTYLVGLTGHEDPPVVI